MSTAAAHASPYATVTLVGVTLVAPEAPECEHARLLAVTGHAAIQASSIRGVAIEPVEVDFTLNGHPVSRVLRAEILALMSEGGKL